MGRPDRLLAQTFLHAGVATAYRHRPPYPDAVFDLLLGLIVDRPRRVLDLGAGEGALARPLAAAVDEVEAVEPSLAMIEEGRRRPGGDASNLRWLAGSAESCPLNGPYALIVAGASFHWFDWSLTLSRLVSVMSDGAVLALVEHGPRVVPWQRQLDAVIQRFSRSTDHDPHFDLEHALRATGRFRPLGEVVVPASSFRQRAADYVEHFHSTASLARELMSDDEARSFDKQLNTIVSPHTHNGELELQVEAVVRWGRPQ